MDQMIEKSSGFHSACKTQTQLIRAGIEPNPGPTESVSVELKQVGKAVEAAHPVPPPKQVSDPAVVASFRGSDDDRALLKKLVRLIPKEDLAKFNAMWVEEKMTHHCRQVWNAAHRWAFGWGPNDTHACACCEWRRKKKSSNTNPNGGQGSMTQMQQTVLGLVHATSEMKGQSDGAVQAASERESDMAQLAKTTDTKLADMADRVKGLTQLVAESGMTPYSGPRKALPPIKPWRSTSTVSACDFEKQVKKRLGPGSSIAQGAGYLVSLCEWLDNLCNVLVVGTSTPLPAIKDANGKIVDMRHAGLLPGNLRDTDPSLYIVDCKFGISNRRICVSAALLDYLIGLVNMKSATDDFLMQICSKCRNINLQSTFLTGDTRPSEVSQVITGTILYFRAWQHTQQMDFPMLAVEEVDVGSPGSTDSVIALTNRVLVCRPGSSPLLTAAIGPLVTFMLASAVSALWDVMSLDMLSLWLIAATLSLCWLVFTSDSVELLLALTRESSVASAISSVSGYVSTLNLFLQMWTSDLSTGCLKHITVALVVRSCGVFTQNTLIYVIVIIVARVLLRLKRILSGNMLALSIHDLTPSSVLRDRFSKPSRTIFSVVTLALGIILLSTFLLLIGRAFWPNAYAKPEPFTTQAISQLLSLSSQLTSSVASSFSSIVTSAVDSAGAKLTSSAISSAPSLADSIAASSAAVSTSMGVECPATLHFSRERIYQPHALAVRGE